MRKLLLLSAILISCAAASAQTVYYVDPAFTGGGNNGSITNPWTALSSGCSTINTTLASADVIVYFSATQSQTGGLNLGCRTNTGTHVLTLNGTEKVNSNDGVNNNVTNWVAGVTLSPCTGYRCAATGAWIGHQFQFSGGGGGAVFSNNNVNACQNFINVRGFKFVGTGQVGVFTYFGNTTIEYNEFTDTSGNIGPTVYIGAGQHGPCNASSSNVGGPDNVVYQYNWSHNGYGECLYDGASTSDPAGGPGSAEYTTNGMTCTTNCNTGAHHRILYNTDEACAVWGGQGDGMDIKDGHGDIQIIGNSILPSVSGGGADGQGIVFESCSVISGNYIEQPNHEGLAMFNSWNNATGRSDNCSIVNNLVVNVTGGSGHKNGFEIQSPALAGSLQVWTVPVTIANNTFFTTTDPCITVAGSSLSGGTGAVAKNNICVSTGGGVTGGSVYSSHDYNEYFNATGVTCPVSGEPNSICTDPGFVSTSTPFNANNFKLSSTSSPAHNTGLNLTSLGITQLSTDYFGTTRGTLWDRGFFSFSSAAPTTQTMQGVVLSPGVVIQ